MMNYPSPTRSAQESQVTCYRFPSGFLWGAATSSHQVEGNNVANDWWEFEQAGRLPYRSGEACRHWDLYEQDFELARSLGHNAHRFSIEWSRVEPAEGRWSEEAIAHYRAVVAALLRRGIEPVVTLHHFTHPAWFARRGGWLGRDAAASFARYAERMAAELPGVRYWLTLNEPTVWTRLAYMVGEWPPCVRGAWPKAVRVLWSQARAHVVAYQALHASAPAARVGLAHNVPCIQPCDPRRRRDRLAARARDLLLNDAFLYIIGALPAGGRRGGRHLDFLGINYYTRSVVRGGTRGRALVLGDECTAGHHPDHGPLSDIGFEVYPAGLLAVLQKFSTLRRPLLVTENGIATTDEALRTVFVHEHLVALGEAVRRGLDVIGYLYWSLIDNFEWALGTTPRYGLTAVDYRTQARVPRPAAELYARVCRSHELVDPPGPL